MRLSTVTLTTFLLRIVPPSVTRDGAIEYDVELQRTLASVIMGKKRKLENWSDTTKYKPTSVGAGNNACLDRERSVKRIFFFWKENWGSQAARQSQSQRTSAAKPLDSNAYSMLLRHLGSLLSSNAYRSGPGQGAYCCSEVCYRDRHGEKAEGCRTFFIGSGHYWEGGGRKWNERPASRERRVIL